MSHPAGTDNVASTYFEKPPFELVRHRLGPSYRERVEAIIKCRPGTRISCQVGPEIRETDFRRFLVALEELRQVVATWAERRLHVQVYCCRAPTSDLALTVQDLARCRLLQPCVLRLGLFVDGNVGIGVLPNREEILIRLARSKIIVRLEAPAAISESFDELEILDLFRVR